MIFYWFNINVVLLHDLNALKHWRSSYLELILLHHGQRHVDCTVDLLYCYTSICCIRPFTVLTYNSISLWHPVATKTAVPDTGALSNDKTTRPLICIRTINNQNCELVCTSLYNYYIHLGAVFDFDRTSITPEDGVWGTGVLSGPVMKSSGLILLIPSHWTSALFRIKDYRYLFKQCKLTQKG